MTRAAARADSVAGPGGQTRTTLDVRVTGSHLTTGSSDQVTPGPDHEPTTPPSLAPTRLNATRPDTYRNNPLTQRGFVT